ncbi:hypothetical protein [uncultured Nostoc sp.]
MPDFELNTFLEEEFRSQNQDARSPLGEDSLTLRYPLFRSELMLNSDD